MFLFHTSFLGTNGLKSSIEFLPFLCSLNCVPYDEPFCRFISASVPHCSFPPRQGPGSSVDGPWRRCPPFLCAASPDRPLPSAGAGMHTCQLRWWRRRERPGGAQQAPGRTLQGERCPAGCTPLQRALSSMPVLLARPAGSQSGHLEPCFSSASVHAEPQTERLSISFESTLEAGGAARAHCPGDHLY